MEYIGNWNCSILGTDTLVLSNAKQLSKGIITLMTASLFHRYNSFPSPRRGQHLRGKLLNVVHPALHFGFNVHSLLVNELEHLFRTLGNIRLSLLLFCKITICISAHLPLKLFIFFLRIYKTLIHILNLYITIHTHTYSRD